MGWRAIGAAFGLSAALAGGGFALVNSTAAAASRKGDDLKGPLVIKQQGSFFVGGKTQRSEALTGVASGGDLGPNQGEITTGQMYVQFQVPERGGGTPIVLIHGGALSGKGL